MNPMQLKEIAKQVDDYAAHLPGTVTITNILLVDHGSPHEYVQVDFDVTGFNSAGTKEHRRMTIKTSDLT